VFQKTPAQIQAVDLMCNYTEVLLEGGSRSGKTFIEIYAQIARGIKYDGSRHLSLRKHFNHAKLSLWMQTIPDVFKKAFPTVKYKQNKTDFYIEFGEDSQLWIGGTDDKERIEKILGSEWDTILLNEISQIPFSTYELLKTRLNPRGDIKPLLLLDQNPPSMAHWSYLKFHLGLNPETRKPLKEEEKADICYFKMNPADNKRNLSKSYLSILDGLSESKKRRFLYGEYSDDSDDALFKRDWIYKGRVDKEPEKLDKIVVAVDPAVTGGEMSAETGIIIIGRAKIDKEYHFYILEDRSFHGQVTGWGQVVAQAYKDFFANTVIGEVNNGGDLVEANIRNYDRNIRYESVRATRGKAKRAEPVADLYERGLVHHVGEFPELEDQMCTWIEGSDTSPDRMDALVWGISYLSEVIREGKIIKTIGW